MKTQWGTLFYDGNCRFCTDGAHRLSGWLARRGVEIAPFEIAEGESLPEEMRLRCEDGREFGGADAVLLVVEASWWGKPLAWIGRLPGFYTLLNAGYRGIARRRYCVGGTCELPHPPKADRVSRRITLATTWWITVLLTLVAGWAGDALELENWGRMWLLAVAMWLGFKILALNTTAAGGWPGGLGGGLGFALWPGMDVAAFARRERPKIYREAEWKVALAALLRMVVGLLLVFWGDSRVTSPVAVGWCGMVGLVLVLHFGVFDLLALFWRRLGFDVERLMQAPWRAHSLADFWGGRWNRAFSHVANRALFRPMTRRFGLAWGTLAGFLLSGVVHEVVISVAARGGHGLPTMYFLLQGLGVLMERQLGWRGDWRGTVLMGVVLLAPAFWLFHPLFMAEVMAPMVELGNSVFEL